MNVWTTYRGWRLGDLGLLPAIVNSIDSRPVAEQVADKYRHGGGWSPFKGFKLAGAGGGRTLRYPEDPPLHMVASTRIRDEEVLLFEGDWLCVVQPDGTFAVSRID